MVRERPGLLYACLVASIVAPVYVGYNLFVLHNNKNALMPNTASSLQFGVVGAY